MTLPSITIGIQTYNRASGTLVAALQSALAQTYPHVEVVVSDNCSTDGTESLIRGMEHERLRYVRHERNLGSNGNFNACLAAAHGDYFLLLHDDDLIEPDFVEACVAALPPGRPVGFIRTGIRVIDADGETLSTIPNRSTATTLRGFVLDWFASKTSPYCCNTLLNTAALRAVGGFRSRHNLFNDVLAHVKVAASHGCANVPEVKASFRRHGANRGSNALLRNWCEDSIELLDTIARLVPDADIEALGKPFLCRMNYSYAAELEPAWRRVNGYFTVARQFGFSQPPTGYIYRQEVRPRLRAIKRRLSGQSPPTSASRLR
jgi:glycosyltransferase involved in cell wall biosynthesis